MESFGRTVALVVGIIGIVFLLLFSKTVSARWQRHETVRSMSRSFAETLLRDKMIFVHEWEVFRMELLDLGNYRAELAVYERRRFEDEDGGFYLFEKAEIAGDRVLREGSYVRLLITPEEREDVVRLLSGDCGVIVAGGRVQ